MAQQRRTREKWRQLVEGWADSGLTQSQYCARHRISVASLHRWREVLHRESAALRGSATASDASPSAARTGAGSGFSVSVSVHATAPRGFTPIAHNNL